MHLKLALLAILKGNKKNNLYFFLVKAKFSNLLSSISHPVVTTMISKQKCDFTHTHLNTHTHTHTHTPEHTHTQSGCGCYLHFSRKLAQMKMSALGKKVKS